MTTASDPAPPHGRREPFLTTRWSLVLSAAQPGSPEADAALAELCRTYWFPLYAYVRRQGRTREDAEDLVQTFFARFLESRPFAGLNAGQGRFRAFLLASLKHFLANEWDRARTQKRGGGAAHFSLEWTHPGQPADFEPTTPSEAERLYDREWALALLDRVLGRLETECAREGRSALFTAAKRFLTFDADAIPYATAAAKLGLEPAALRVAVHRLRKRYRELLRDEIAHTLHDPSRVTEELHALLEALAG